RFTKLVERLPHFFIQVTAGNTCNTLVVHRPEDQVCTYQSHPEMDIGKCVVHKAPIHLGEPVIDTRKHAKERCHTHYKVEVSNHKYCIVKMNVNCRVTQPDTGKTT